jgi:hypothetical protein
MSLLIFRYCVGPLEQEPAFAVMSPDHAEADWDWGSGTDGEGSWKKIESRFPCLMVVTFCMSPMWAEPDHSRIVREHGGDGIEPAEDFAGIAAVDDGVVVDGGDDGLGVAVSIGVEKDSRLRLDVGCLCVQPDADEQPRTEQ